MPRFLAALLIALTAFFSVPAVAAGKTKAIDFQFTDIDGHVRRLSDFKGKWVLVNFWAPWCPLCWAEVPTLNQLSKRADFAVIGIGLDYGSDSDVVRETANNHRLDVDAVIAGGARRDPASPFRQVGPVDFYPTSYLYDPNGEIVMFIPGQVRSAKVLAFMESWKAERRG